MSPDKALAFAYLPARIRPAVEALFAIDAAMADVVRTTREPMIGQIRLAWWRERLEELDKGLPVPPEPRLQAAAAQLLPSSISGEDAAAPEAAWLTVLSAPFPWDRSTVAALAARGAGLFHHATRLLGCSNDGFEDAGALWAIMDVARHCTDEASRRLLVDEGRVRARALRHIRFPSVQRPLTSLTALAARDAMRGEPFEPEGTRGRALAIFRHRLTGRLPSVHLTRTAP